VPELNQKPGEPAHAAASDANKMNPMALPSDESLQVKRWNAISKRTALFRSEVH
jgi:hypothetical protein